MKVTSTAKMLFGALALTVAGSALADTTLATLSPGSVVLNVVDATNGTSFLFATNQTTSSNFGAGTSYTYDLSGDANWLAFLAGRASSSDELSYDVIGVVAPTTTAGIRQAFTTSGTDIAVTNFNLTQAATTGRNYYNAVNGTTSTTTNSEYSSAGAADAAKWGTSEQQWSTSLGGATDLVGLDTANAFYSVVQNGTASGSRTTNAFVTKFGNWTLTSAGSLTYSAVPLPASWTLVLSGLALMGVIARRRKTTGSDFSFTALAG